MSPQQQRRQIAQIVSVTVSYEDGLWGWTADADREVGGRVADYDSGDFGPVEKGALAGPGWPWSTDPKATDAQLLEGLVDALSNPTRRGAELQVVRYGHVDESADFGTTYYTWNGKAWEEQE